MQCPKCGTPILPNQKFCTKCGQPVLQQPSAPRPQMPTPPRPQMPTPPQVSKAVGSGRTPMPQAPRPVSAPQPPKIGMPTPPRPNKAPQMPPRLVVPSVPQTEEKGVLRRVASGVASAITGGSFSRGYDQQREREETYRALMVGFPLKIKDAQATFNNIKKKYPNAVDSTDEIEFNQLIEAASNAANDRSGNIVSCNSRIKKAFANIDKFLYEIKVKADPSLSGTPSENGTTTRQHHISTAELHDINPDECAIVENKATWGIQRGQVARRITERELDAVDGLNGFIIQQGCSAMIFVNGELVKVMESGAYQLQVKSDNDMKKMIEALTNQLMQNHKDKVKTAEEAEHQRLQNLSVAERGGLAGIACSWIKRGLQFVFGSTPVAKKSNRDEELEAMKRFKVEAERIVKEENKQPLLSIILISNRHFNLTFGGIESEDGITFNPYVIPMGFLDVNIGVEVEMQISNISDFATNYLTDRNSLTTNDVFKMLTFDVETVLRQALRNQEYTQQGLDGNTKTTLAQKIKSSINNRLYGIECTQILNITDSQDDVFGRFRQVEKEIYSSEKELEYMTRTGEIRNRMEQEQNHQLLNSARNKEDYSYAMQQIDKDHLLHDDEMQEFVLMLETQRQIREATTKEEAYEKLLVLQGNRLVKEDELEAIKDGIEHEKINRAEITNIMRIQSNRNVEMERQQADWALDDTKQDHDWEREDLERKRSWGIEDEEREREWIQEEREYDRQRGRLKAEDDYDFAQMMRKRQVDIEDHARERQEYIEDEERARAHKLEDDQLAYDRQRQSKFDDSDINLREQQAQTDNLLKIMEAERQAKADELRTQESMHQATMNRDIEVEKVGKANALEQADFFRLQQQKAEHDAKEREANARADRNADMDRMERMMGMFGDKMVGMSQNLMGAQQQRAEDYRKQAEHAQQRQDHAQDQAFTAMGSVAAATASNVAAFNGGANVAMQQAPQSVLPQESAQPQQTQKGMEQTAQTQNSYYLYTNDQQYGPYPMTELQQYASQGVLTPQTLVYTEGMADWAQAADVAELAQLFS